MNITMILLIMAGLREAHGRQEVSLSAAGGL